MRPSDMKVGFLGTRVGRRTLLNFLLAALLPVLVVSVLGIWYVRQTLETEASERVQRSAKSSALTLLGELSSAARRVAEDRPEALSAAPRDSFTDQELSHLREGAVLLRLGPTNSSEGAVRLFRQFPSGVIRATTVAPSALWSSLDELIDVDRTSLCIFQVGSWQRVHCAASVSATTEAALRTAAMRAEGSEGDSRSEGLFMAHRDLYLRFELASAEWRLVAAEDRSQALAPAATVTTSLMLMMALAVVVAFVFAHQQIRRSTAPLEALRDATRRVAGGDLDTPVTITSRDEYGELGVAFNGMTNSISAQLALLHRMDAVDEVTLRERRIEAIVETSLDGFRHVAGCQQASIVIVGDHADAVATQWRVDRLTPGYIRMAASLSEGECRVLRDNPRYHINGSRAAAGEARSGDASIVPASTQVVLPLLHDDELLGAITFHVDGVATGDAPLVLDARRIADRVVLGVANVRLLNRLDALSSGTLRAFARAIDANSHWTAGHSERVTRLALALGRQLGLPRHALSILYRGGLMHDIGKIGIPPEVLDKAGRLDPEERAMIERHPEIGERILKPIPAFADALSIVRSHHEHYDGNGYPDRLVGESIPWLARILAVADVYDALVSDRPYRAGLSHQAASSMIEAGAGSQFDPRVVAAMLALDLASSPAPGVHAEVESIMDVDIVRATPLFTRAVA